MCTIERKNGAKIQKNTYIMLMTRFGPLLPNCKVRDAVFGLACKRGQKLAGLNRQLVGQSYQREIEGISVDKIASCCRFNLVPRVVMLKYDKVPAS